MSTSQRVPVPDPVSEGVDALRNSVSLLILAAGALLFFAGFALRTGVWAAILAVWGTALMLVGATAYAIVWWSYR